MTKMRREGIGILLMVLLAAAPPLVSTGRAVAAVDDEDDIEESIRFQRAQEAAARAREAEQERIAQQRQWEEAARRREQLEASRQRDAARAAAREAEESSREAARLRARRWAQREAQDRAEQARQERMQHETAERAHQEGIRKALERFNHEAAQRRDEQENRDRAARRYNEAHQRQMDAQNPPGYTQRGLAGPGGRDPSLRELLDPAAGFLKEVPGNSAAIRIGKNLLAAEGLIDDAQRIRAAESAVRELQFFQKWSEQQLDGIMKTIAEGERLRQNGGLNPDQQQFMNELQRRRIQLLSERGLAIKILAKHFSLIPGS